MPDGPEQLPDPASGLTFLSKSRQLVRWKHLMNSALWRSVMQEPGTPASRG